FLFYYFFFFKEIKRFFFFFFFSSRRRHTRYWRDWSSDVCSSDLRSSPRAAKNGSSRPTAFIARTGELTPPGISSSARLYRDERVVRATGAGLSSSTRRSGRRRRA